SSLTGVIEAIAGCRRTGVNIRILIVAIVFPRMIGAFGVLSGGAVSICVLIHAIYTQATIWDTHGSLLASDILSHAACPRRTIPIGCAMCHTKRTVPHLYTKVLPLRAAASGGIRRGHLTTGTPRLRTRVAH